MLEIVIRLIFFRLNFNLDTGNIFLIFQRIIILEFQNGIWMTDIQVLYGMNYYLMTSFLLE